VNTALVKRDLLSSLRSDREYRHAWNLENVYTSVCFQLRALREQRKFSQAAFGKEANMAPERISILEDPNAPTKPTLNTLLRIANACDVGLEVRFVPYKVVIDRSTTTDLKALEVPSFDEELPELEASIAELALAPMPEVLVQGSRFSIPYFSLGQWTSGTADASGGVLPHAEMTSSNPAGIPRRGPFAERNPSPNQGEVRTENSSASGAATPLLGGVGTPVIPINAKTLDLRSRYA
jgi:transcriptional regulator with XRE-family HTH domain